MSVPHSPEGATPVTGGPRGAERQVEFGLVRSMFREADSAYHTERLGFEPTTVSETGSGMVVNIHANGPVIGALERYQLKNAQPNTNYDVWLVVDGEDFTSTATIRTDRHGNGLHRRDSRPLTSHRSAEQYCPSSGFYAPAAMMRMPQRSRL